MDRREDTMLESSLIDPVCGERIDPGKPAEHYRYEDRTYHFCSRRCLARFRADPGAYVRRPPA